MSLRLFIKNVINLPQSLLGYPTQTKTPSDIKLYLDRMFPMLPSTLVQPYITILPIFASYSGSFRRIFVIETLPMYFGASHIIKSNNDMTRQYSVFKEL